MWFDKPLSSLIMSGATFKLPEGRNDDIHHEVEMGVVIGMRGRNIKYENVSKHIAGYFIGIDFTNRTLQRDNCVVKGDWPLAKGSNQYAAVSEFVHKSAVKDIKDVDVELKINGLIRQKSNTKNMIFDVPSMIEDISKY